MTFTFASGLVAGQHEPNSVCYNLSFLKSFLCFTVTGIKHQLEEVLTLQTLKYYKIIDPAAMVTCV